MQALVIILGVALVVVGLYFAVGGFAPERSAGGYRNFRIEVPAWLFLVVVGIGVVAFGVYEPWERNPPTNSGGTQGPGIDSDGDGLADVDESSLGTDAFNPDSDNDGLSDGDEVQQGTDLCWPTATGMGSRTVTRSGKRQIRAMRRRIPETGWNVQPLVMPHGLPPVGLASD